MKSSLNDNFCSSPWFHVRIDPAGQYLPCRWSSHQDPTGYYVANTSIAEFMNSDIMSGIRARMLDGNGITMCSACLYEDTNNKVSGRQKQLLKSAISLNNFEKTFCSSPHWGVFEYSSKNQGRTTKLPVDLQIDLGNTCNSACIMCGPTYSSRLATEYHTLSKLEPLLFKAREPFKNWADDSTQVDKFVDELSQIPNIKYIHFLGGETLYLKSFYSICNKLVDAGIAKDISIGTTTNCSIYTDELVNIIRNFKHVHLGLSVESFNEVNDYIRWPSDISVVKSNIKKFLDLRDQTDLHLSLRITPNILSVYHLPEVFEFMIQNKITAESCNILHNPSCLRLELLPKELLGTVVDKINQVVQTYNLVDVNEKIVNRRREDLVDPVIAQVIFEYKHLLENIKEPADVEQERCNLVKYIRAFEQVHKNTVLDYLPEYEEFLRSYGY